MPALDFVLVWHMHQPDYRDPDTGEFRLPWVYLHAIKDYADMAAHFEACTGMRAVVNFVPILLEQLDDYADQFATGRLRDPLLRLLAKPDGEPFSAEERALALGQCFHADHDRLIAPYPAYKRLHDLWRLADEETLEDAQGYLSDRFLADLVTWYHLAWTGETVRRGSPFVSALLARGAGFTASERLGLLETIATVVRDLVPRWRRLEEAGIVELTTSPWMHPIGPLLLDFECAQEARPALPLPASARYPGGAERLREHLAVARDEHRQRFGREPVGLWPSEGAVSDAFVRALDGSGTRWIASGSQVLEHSLKRAGVVVDERALNRAYRFPTLASDTICVFRDDALADLIGFEFRRWHSGEAAAHFVAQLEAAGRAAHADDRPLVTAIVDGENAWEYYPYNGFYFLNELYDRLARHPWIRTTTMRALLDDPSFDARVGELPGLVAGSWVYGDLTTWIGSVDKNRAWDLLCAAKRALDGAIEAGTLDGDRRREALERLAVAESSDWYWWFGDYHPATSVARFDALFRANLAHLYRCIGVDLPTELGEPVSLGNESAISEGMIRRAS